MGGTPYSKTALCVEVVQFTLIDDAIKTLWGKGHKAVAAGVVPILL